MSATYIKQEQRVRQMFYVKYDKKDTNLIKLYKGSRIYFQEECLSVKLIAPKYKLTTPQTLRLKSKNSGVVGSSSAAVN